jgi:hypothetical protein
MKGVRRGYDPKAALDSRAGLMGWRLHDLRRTAATRMAELSTLPHVIEAVLNHVSGHRAGVAGIYNRATYTKEMREALERWAQRVEEITKWWETSMLEDTQFVLSHVRNGMIEARRLFADQKLKVDRLMAAGEDSQDAQQTLGLLEVYLSILEKQGEHLSRGKKLRQGDLVTPPGAPRRVRPGFWEHDHIIMWIVSKR